MERDPAPKPSTGPTAGGASQPSTLPARVWISRLGTAEPEIEGTLSVTETELRFDHRRGSNHERVPLTSIRKVKRPMGSPLLYVEYDRDGTLVRLAFFFAQPPPLDTAASRVRARRKRSDNAGFMWQQSGDVAFVVRAWRDAIREAVKRAKAKA